MLRHALIAIVVILSVFTVFETGIVDGEDIAGVLDAGTDAVKDTPPEQLYQMIGTSTGTFELLVSDQPTVIDEFQTLEVTFDTARVVSANSSDQVEELALDQPTVDLTAVQDERAIPVLETVLDPGTYQKVELHISDVHAVLKSGDTVSYRDAKAENGDSADGSAENAVVYAPSGKMAIARSFEVPANKDTAFVFDIDIVSRGETNDYILLPNTGESGLVGGDIQVQRVDPGTAGDQ